MRKGLGGPITEEEKKKIDELLHDEAAMEKVVERAVRGMRRHHRRAG